MHPRGVHLDQHRPFRDGQHQLQLVFVDFRCNVANQVAKKLGEVHVLALEMQFALRQPRKIEKVIDDAREDCRLTIQRFDDGAQRLRIGVAELQELHGMSNRRELSMFGRAI